MFNALKNSFNSLGEMLDKHYAKQIEKDLKKGKVLDHRRPFGQVLDEDVLVNRNIDMSDTNNNKTSRSNNNTGMSTNYSGETEIIVGRNKGQVFAQQYQALPVNSALNLLESKLKEFRSNIRSEYSNKGYIDLRIFSVDKNEVHQLSNLTWSDLLKFSRENSTVLGIKEDCEKVGIHCFVKEKAGILTLICCSDKSIFDREVASLISSYRM